MDRIDEDRKIHKMEDASVSMCLGALFLAFAGIAGIFFFQTLRSGTLMWRDFIFIRGGLGVLFMAIGVWGRRMNS